jgi:serine/threonine-protein kinase
LEAAGFVAVRAPQYTMSVPINYVIQTAPSGLRPYGSSVTVTISLGPPFVTVPKLYRDSAGQAATALTKVGLQISEHRGFGGDTVSVQIPSANSSVREGTVVNVFLLPIYLFP